jgi:hypothetical protein
MADVNSRSISRDNSAEELIDQKIIEVKKQFKQVTDIQTAIDVQFGEKSPFHTKVKELQAEISNIVETSGDSAQLKRKCDEAQKTLRTCANFRPRTGGFFIRLFLGQVSLARFRIFIAVELLPDFDRMYRSTWWSSPRRPSICSSPSTSNSATGDAAARASCAKCPTLMFGTGPL